MVRAGARATHDHATSLRGDPRSAGPYLERKGERRSGPARPGGRRALRAPGDAARALPEALLRTAPPWIQRRVVEGWPGLHVLVVHTGGAAGMRVRALAAARGGAERIERLPDVDSFLVDRCVVRLAAGAVELAADGEILSLRLPLEYLAHPGALRAVAP